MESAPIFRWILLFVLITCLGTSAYHRLRARQSGEVIARSRESGKLIFLRLFVALPLFLSVLAFVIHPPWMAWSVVGLPVALRFVGAALGLAAWPLIHWVLGNLGKNVSETTLTKRDHELVDSGPYRWVRHPLYSVGTLFLVSLTLLTASWWVALFTAVGVSLIFLVVIPAEERHLVEKFGERYESYRERTGRLFPKLIR